MARISAGLQLDTPVGQGAIAGHRFAVGLFDGGGHLLGHLARRLEVLGA